MLRFFLIDLLRFGKVVIFGSTLNPRVRYPSDFDMALVVPDGSISHAFSSVRSSLVRNGLHKLARVEHLRGYERASIRIKRSRPIHILICESSDLKNDHPIFKSLNDGLHLNDHSGK